MSKDTIPASQNKVGATETAEVKTEKLNQSQAGPEADASTQRPKSQRQPDFNEVEEIEILDKPADPVPGGVDFGKIIQYWPIVTKFLSSVLAGSGSFIIRIAGKKLRVTIEPA